MFSARRVNSFCTFQSISYICNYIIITRNSLTSTGIVSHGTGLTVLTTAEPQNGYPEMRIKGYLGYGCTKVKRKTIPKEKFKIPRMIWVACK